jgi:4-methylaminobutanoate oxidase (formaldehyde-forming)
MTDAPPTHARVVVIGGGVVGCSVAYHLAAHGCRDVVVLERERLGCGTTWHAAASIGRLANSALVQRLYAYTVELLPRLEAESGLTVGWRNCGRVQLASTRKRLDDLRHIAAVGRAVGTPFEIISPREAVEKLPIITPEGLVGALWSPGNGRVNPTELTAAFAEAARRRGVRILEKSPVTAVRTRQGAVTGVGTPGGDIGCEVVVNCAGLWARSVAALCGVDVPLYANEHFYLLTKPMPGVTADLPTFSDRDALIYGREEVGGLLVGFFDREAKPVSLERLPPDFAFGLLEEDWDHAEPYLQTAVRRIPTLAQAEIHMLLNGPESFTPDGTFLMGEAPGLRGFFTLAGMNSAGINFAAGAGRAIAGWITTGDPGIDVSAFDLRRFAPIHNREAWLRERVREVPSTFYLMHRGEEEFHSGRMLRLSPLHGRLAARGARFGSVMGWERPEYFAGSSIDGDRRACVLSEQRAARRGAVVFDRTATGKLLLEGPEAPVAVRRLTPADVDGPPGTAVVAPFLNVRGGIESLPIIVRLALDAWLVLTGPLQVIRDADWIRRHSAAAGVRLTDLTAEWAMLALAGPQAPRLLERLGMPGSVARELASGNLREVALRAVPVRLLRCPLTEEWQLLVAAGQAPAVYDRLWEAAAGLELRDAGHLAAEALRIERVIPTWGRELGPTVHLHEAGLDIRTLPGQREDFIGADALRAQAGQTPRRALRGFKLTAEPEAPIYGGEPIWRADACVGFVSSVAFVGSLGGTVVTALVGVPGSERGYELDVSGERYLLEPYRATP